MQLGNGRVSSRLLWVIFLLLFLSTILVIIVPYPNDDTYVYFNYARNFVAGRPFAYDARNIPTEGFTSLLYLMLLIPFEAFHINMAFVSILLNILALFLMIGFGTGLAAKILGRNHAVTFGLVFSSLIIVDVNVVPIAAHGLETLFNPVSVFASAYLIARACDKDDPKRVLALHLFFVAAFLSFLIRPENIVMVGACGGLVLLIFYPNRRKVILDGIIFGVVLALYFGVKYIVFHDLLPTGFYRKVGDNFLGEAYVVTALVDYLPWIIGGLMLSAVTLRKSRQLFKNPALAFLGFLSVITLVFFSHTNPLVGYNYRFLINATTALLFFISLLVVYWIGNRWQNILYGLAVVILVSTVYLKVKSSDNSLIDLNLYKRTVTSVNDIAYVQFGTYLRAHLPNYEKMTLVFGDAGIFPYAFQSRFVDADGLAEPFLAHLFRLPDGPDKAEKYTNYILSWKPDIIIMGYGAVDGEGAWIPPVNPHSPFQAPQPLSVFASFRDYGMEYVCSVKSIYDIHVTVWKDSPYYKSLVTTLRGYCEENGYMLAGGFVVKPNGGKVVFPPAL